MSSHESTPVRRSAARPTSAAAVASTPTAGPKIHAASKAVEIVAIVHSAGFMGPSARSAAFARIGASGALIAAGRTMRDKTYGTTTRLTMPGTDAATAHIRQVIVIF